LIFDTFHKSDFFEYYSNLPNLFIYFFEKEFLPNLLIFDTSYEGNLFCLVG